MKAYVIDTRPIERSLGLGLVLAAACRGGQPRAGESAAGEAGREPAAASAADRPAATSRPLRDPVPLTATLSLDGKRYTFAGQGECHHTGDASIYQVPAALWSAAFDTESGDFRNLNLTLWQPKDDPVLQVSLGITAGEQTLQVATVKGAEQHGSGTGRVDAGGAGGKLAVDGRDADGRSLHLEVNCSRFTEPVAEGG